MFAFPQTLILSKADFTSKDKHGLTPIKLAFKSCKKDKIDFCLSMANVDIVNKCHLLHSYVECARNPQKKVMTKLLELGADLQMLDDFGYTVLNYATLNGDLNTLKFLINNGADVDGVNDLGWEYDCYSELSFAVAKGNFETVKFLLEQGADPNSTYLEMFPLFALFDTGEFSIEIVDLLLKYGADINRRFRNFWSALVQAATNDEREIVELLLEGPRSYRY